MLYPLYCILLTGIRNEHRDKPPQGNFLGPRGRGAIGGHSGKDCLVAW